MRSIRWYRLRPLARGAARPCVALPRVLSSYSIFLESERTHASFSHTNESADSRHAPRATRCGSTRCSASWCGFIVIRSADVHRGHPGVRGCCSTTWQQRGMAAPWQAVAWEGPTRGCTGRAHSICCLGHRERAGTNRLGQRIAFCWLLFGGSGSLGSG